MEEIRIVDENEIPRDYVYDTETDEFYCYRNKYTGKEIHIAKKPPLYVKAIPIPEGATNGDMIKAVFPDCKFEFNTDESCYLTFKGNLCSMQINPRWWYAPYKKNGEEKPVTKEEEHEPIIIKDYVYLCPLCNKWWTEDEDHARKLNMPNIVHETKIIKKAHSFH